MKSPVPPRALRWFAVSAALLLAGCGQQGGAAPLACTEIGAHDGVSVTVAADTAHTVTAVELEACWNNQCRPGDIELHPGTYISNEGCDSLTCWAESSPDGTSAGFAVIEGLPEGHLTVKVTVSHSDGTQKHWEAQVRTTAVHPNGEQCEPYVRQAGVLLDASGLRSA